MKPKAVQIKRCLDCRHGATGYVNIWQNRDAFFVDCLRLARIPDGNCPLYEQEETA